jgi:BMFP domain-containing protein YqiC
MSAVGAAIAEIEQLLPQWQQQLDGLLDFSRIDIDSAAREQVDAAFVDLNRRITLSQSALAALRELSADGYPSELAKEVEDAVTASLQAQLASMQAAMSRFVGRRPAVGGSIEFSAQ